MLPIDYLFRAQKRKPSLRYVIPDEGSALLANSRSATRPELARAFIKLLLDPEVVALSANSWCFATPNRAALERA
ncbi:MAG: hypothetical protein R6X02_27735 [Enhygromyxa sp.]